MDHRVKGIDESDDPGADRDRLPAQLVGIPESVPALVMVSNDRREDARAREGPADLLADLGMSSHLGAFGLGQRTRLGQDRLGDAEVADVVDERSEHDALEVGAAQTELPGELVGEPRHPGPVLGAALLVGTGPFAGQRRHDVRDVHLGRRAAELQGRSDRARDFVLVERGLEESRRPRHRDRR